MTATIYLKIILTASIFFALFIFLAFIFNGAFGCKKCPKLRTAAVFGIAVCVFIIIVFALLWIWFDEIFAAKPVIMFM